MSIRTAPGLIVCSIVLSAALGCSMQSSAPSATGSVPALRSSSNSPSEAPQPVASSSRFGSRTPGVVYVTSQGLYYDTFVVTDPLPMKGPFQLLTNGQTEFGPGQPGYLGGRWWE